MTICVTDQLLKKHPVISDQVDVSELRVLMCELEKILQTGGLGNIVEFGCYIGTTSLFIRRLLDEYGFQGEFHVYDSFTGLPEKTKEDSSVVGEQFQAGELAASRRIFLQNFKKAGLRPPIIHKSWFSDVVPSQVPDDICFAFFDGDFYGSIRDSFRVCENKFTQGASIVVDDYANEALPGAARAVDEWRRSHHVKLRVEHSLAILRLKV